MRAIRVIDDRRKVLHLSGPAQRIVSLVPSDTFNLFYLGAGERLIGRTRYCVEPAAEVSRVPEVGGTKDADVDAIVQLAPDIVIANQEENSRPDIERLEAAGLKVLLSFPKRVADGLAHLGRLAKVLGFDADPVAGARAKKGIGELYRLLRHAEAKRAEARPLRAFLPIWADPLMTANRDAFLSDALDLAGAVNVFADRERRYPLAADLGLAATFPTWRTEDKDTRYPRITLDEVRAHAPEIVLLPDEPHPFSDADARRFRELDIPAARHDNVVFCDGKDSMWYGARAILGLARLGALVDEARARIDAAASPRDVRQSVPSV
jgi:ABC-type Fe3+-hydroxamate transport system substrate-binding protein